MNLDLLANSPEYLLLDNLCPYLENHGMGKKPITARTIGTKETLPCRNSSSTVRCWSTRASCKIPCLQRLEDMPMESSGKLYCTDTDTIWTQKYV